MFLYLAQFRGADKRIAVLLWKSGWHQYFQIDLIDHAGQAIGMNTLHDLNSTC